jgi:hypothetical protein
VEEVAVFYFRLNKVRIVENREGSILFGLLKRDRAEIQFLSLVTTGGEDFPDLAELLATDDPARRREITADIVRRVAAFRKLHTVENVRDGHIFPFGDTGYNVFQADTIPDHFNWLLLAVEIDEDVRDLGAALEQEMGRPDFDDFVLSFLTLVQAADNPVLAAAVAAMRFLGSVWARQLQGDTNDQAGLLYMSLNRWEHYPHGKRDRQDVPDLTGNMFVDYTLFAIEAAPPLA